MDNSLDPIIAFLEENREMVLAAILKEATGQWEGSRLVISLGSRWGWHFDQLKGPRRKELEAVLQKLYPGTEYLVRMVPEEDEEQPGNEREKAREKVELVKKMFGAKPDNFTRNPDSLTHSPDNSTHSPDSSTRTEED